MPSDRPGATPLTGSIDDVYLRTVMLMGTWVTIQVVGHGADQQQAIDRRESVERAFEWFRRVEACCTRFDPQSEAMRLTARIGVPVPVSAILFEAVQFALAVAEESGGAFDPTIGHAMETRGFNREYRTGRIVQTAARTGRARQLSGRPPGSRSEDDHARSPADPRSRRGREGPGDRYGGARTEARSRTMRSMPAGTCIVAGRSPDGAPWSVGIRHPRREDRADRFAPRFERGGLHVGRLRTDGARGRGHHILDPRTGASADAVASVTVVAPTAMAGGRARHGGIRAGPRRRHRLLERQGVEGPDGVADARAVCDARHVMTSAA